MSAPEIPRTWTLVFCEDHRGMRFVEAYEADPVDVQRKRLLDVIEGLPDDFDSAKLIAEASIAALFPGDGEQ